MRNKQNTRTDFSTEAKYGPPRWLSIEIKCTRIGSPAEKRSDQVKERTLA
jgi:hypothetical protein